MTTPQARQQGRQAVQMGAAVALTYPPDSCPPSLCNKETKQAAAVGELRRLHHHNPLLCLCYKETRGEKEDRPGGKARLPAGLVASSICLQFTLGAHMPAHRCSLSAALLAADAGGTRATLSSRQAVRPWQTMK